MTIGIPQEEQFVYKVAEYRRYSPQKGQFGSIVFDQNGYALIYGLLKETNPILKGSKIFVFKDLQSAKSFMDKEGTYDKVIFKCKFTGQLTRLPLRSEPLTHKISRYWTEYLMDKFTYLSTLDTPIGTYGVDSVTPIEIIFNGLIA